MNTPPKTSAGCKPIDWHKKVLQKRLAKVEAGRGEFLTLTQLKKRLAKFVGDDVRNL